MSLVAARLDHPVGQRAVVTGPWHRFDEVTRYVASTLAAGVVPTICGIDLPMAGLSFAQHGYDQSRDVVCGDCTRSEALRLASLGHQLRAFGYRSDRDGRCRHGVYVGGSGIDWMCGECESYGLDEEIAEYRAAAARVLRQAAYVEVPQ